MKKFIKQYEEHQKEINNYQSLIQYHKQQQIKLLETYKKDFSSIWFLQNDENDTDYPTMAKLFYKNGKIETLDYSNDAQFNSDIGIFARQIWINDMQNAIITDMEDKEFISASEKMLLKYT